MPAWVTWPVSGRRLGALEISLAFLGNYDNEDGVVPEILVEKLKG